MLAMLGAKEAEFQRLIANVTFLTSCATSAILKSAMCTGDTVGLSGFFTLSVFDILFDDEKFGN